MSASTHKTPATEPKSFGHALRLRRVEELAEMGVEIPDEARAALADPVPTQAVQAACPHWPYVWRELSFAPGNIAEWPGRWAVMHGRAVWRLEQDGTAPPAVGRLAGKDTR